MRPRIPFVSRWLHRRKSLRFFRPFVGPGELVFDVGAHHGSSVETFLALGARVVAVEPRDACVSRLRQRWAGSPRVAIIAAAAGAVAGRAVLHLSSSDQVATLSPGFLCAYPGGEGLTWGGTDEVPVVTLAELAREHGDPVFCKVDAEGWDEEVLAGLGRIPRALCFESLGRLPDVTEACVNLLARRASAVFNYRVYDRAAFELSVWVGAGEIVKLLVDRRPRPEHADVFVRFSG